MFTFLYFCLIFNIENKLSKQSICGQWPVAAYRMKVCGSEYTYGDLTGLFQSK